MMMSGERKCFSIAFPAMIFCLGLEFKPPDLSPSLVFYRFMAPVFTSHITHYVETSSPSERFLEQLNPTTCFLLQKYIINPRDIADHVCMIKAVGNDPDCCSGTHCECTVYFTQQRTSILTTNTVSDSTFNTIFPYN